jgi:heme oxygenase
MSLKELTKDNHSNAERQEFVKILFSGSIDPKLYATYLYNQFPMYELLEVCAMPHGLFAGLPDIRRAPAILADYMELWGSDNPDSPKIVPVVDEYIKYILSIKHDPKKLMAHIYVRHMGDLSGGQMIAKRVPGAGKYYEFDGDPNEIKNILRAKLSDDLADEAKVCFDFATRFFEEMMVIADEYQAQQ